MNMDFSDPFMIFSGALVLFIVVIISLIVFLFFKTEKHSVYFEGQDFFDENQYALVEALVSLVNKGSVFYDLKFEPFVDAKDMHCLGAYIRLSNFRIADEIYSSEEVYEWLSKLNIRSSFDITFIEAVFDFISHLPENVKTSVIYSIPIDFNAIKYEGIVREIAVLAEEHRIAVECIELRCNLGNVDYLKAEKIIQSANTFGIKICWDDFGIQLGSFESLVSLSINSVVISPVYNNKIDINSNYKTFLKGFVKFKEGGARIRAVEVLNYRMLDQFRNLDICEVCVPSLSKSLTREEFLNFYLKQGSRF